MQKSTSKPAAASTPAKPVKGGVSAPVEIPKQQIAFEAGIQLFHAREFAKAKHQFQLALEGPAKEMTYAAKQHLMMCEQRLAKSSIKLETPEDHYNYAITLINRRDLDKAKHHLQEALKKQDADYFHYAMALCLGLQHDGEGAAKHLQRAIEIHPKNRSVVVNDADFAEVLHLPAVREVVHGERPSH